MVEQQPESVNANMGASDVGIVYVLTNPAMPDYVKIGFTDDLQRRMSDLDNTSVPVPFECIYAAKVPQPRKWEQTLHFVFAESRINRRREFFTSDVISKAIRIMQTAKIEDVSPTSQAIVEGDEQDAGERIIRLEGRRQRFDFETLQIPDGAQLQFVRDESITCEVVSRKPPRVNFRGEELTLSYAAAKAMAKESSTGIQGPLYWNHEGETLVSRRDRIEREKAEIE